MRSVLLGVLLLLATLNSSFAQTPTARPPVRPTASITEPGSELTISIMTMGVGKYVWERFGHNAIIVTDSIAGTSTAYNYGMFSFQQENFLLKFVQGKMMYWMEGYDAAYELPRYRRMKRSVWLQQLNLTPAQRLAMREHLEWNAREENKFYRYDYYLDNCSTRVRDAIDKVLDGAFHRQSMVIGSGNYRFHTLRLNTNDKLLFTGLLIGEGHGADQLNNRWEEMFLPFKLRDYLREVRIRDSAGVLRPLVIREDTLYQSDAYPVPDQPPAWWPYYLAIGVTIGALLVLGGAARGPAAAAWRTLATLWALINGIGGLVLASLWAFTDHTIAYWNENVLQLTVVALGLAILLPFASAKRPRIINAVRVLSLVVGGLSALGLVLKLLVVFNQYNMEVLALTVPANLGLMFGIRRRLAQ